MERYDSTNLRNIAVLGHQSSGKTTLVESLYYITGGTKVKGEVEKKSTVSDYLAVEQAKQSSVSTSVVPIYHKGHKLNILDIPGNDDFVGEAIGVIHIIKGAVLVVDASIGVQMGTIKHWKFLRKRNIPTFIYINKMDKDGVKYDEVFEDLKSHFGKAVIPFTYPLGHNDGFDGMVNVVDLKARVFNGVECVDAEIYEDKKDKVAQLHEQICEAVASSSDELLDKYFAGEPLTEEEMRTGLRTGVLNGELVPVLVGSATKNIGIHTMLDMFIDYLPNPSDLKPYEATDEAGNLVERKTLVEEPFSAYVFKTIADPYAGIINLFKINSGTIKVGDEILTSGGDTLKVSTLFVMTGKRLDAVEELFAGDIGAMTRLEKVSSGMTLCSPKSVIKYKPVKYPTAVLFKALELKNKNDESKIGPALAKIQLEDPSIEVKRNNETKQLLLGGVSNSHIDFIIDKLKNIYKIEVNLNKMKIVYRESIKKVGQSVGRYVKQSGGSGFYGVVDIRFEPADEISFAEEVFGGAVPKNYFPAVEKGFYEALKSGPLAGFPVIGVRAVLVDGKYHPVDSNEQAFKMAAILAFKEAYPNCSPIILEPIMEVRINIDNKYTGDVMGDLNTRRAKIQDMIEGDNGQEIIALVPEAEIIDYATQLKSITQASGFFNRKFVGYEPVPEYLVDAVIRDNKISE
ncbi:MAG: elongation factor G [Bacilli bacterium]|nr:elongation factor G [Bacilli bacterium]